MNMRNINERELLDFVVKHYEENHLNVDVAWRKFAMLTEKNLQRDFRAVAAAIAGIVFIVAAACGILMTTNMIKEKNEDENVNKVESVKPEKKEAVKVFKYDNSPINDVMDDVSKYYGVHLEANDTMKRMSGEIEMTPSVDGVISILEETLNVSISKK